MPEIFKWQRVFRRHDLPTGRDSLRLFRMVVDSLTPVMPRVLDMFQLYLRELRSSDLEGSAGIFRLKEELLRRINLEIHPNQVNRVLFREIIVQ